MVGTPGRSKACQACKKRRVACDFQKPDCSRCVKAQRKCEYVQNRIFVQQSGGYKSVYRKEDGQSADQEAAVDNQRQGMTETLLLRESSDYGQAVVLVDQPRCSELKQQALLSDALDSNRMPASHGLRAFADGMTYGMTESCLRLSFLACYCSWVGRREHNQRYIDASRGFYIEALRDAHKALVSPETALSESTLASCSALGIYEAIECPNGTMEAYFWHRAACCRLIQMRGPEAHKDGTAHRLFLKMRFFAILDAFDHDCDTFIASPEWMTIPFSIHPKGRLDELVDIFALGPKASRLGKSLATLPIDQLLPTALSIIGQLVVIYNKLQAFQSRLESDDPSPLYWERILPSESELEDPEVVFPPSLWFRDLDMAFLMSLFWSIHTMMWAGLLDLHDFFYEHGLRHLFDAAMKDMGGITRQMVENLLLDRARKVLQSIAYSLTTTAMEFGPPRLLTQLAIVTSVMKYKKVCEAEYKWAVRIQKRMGERYTRILACDI